MSCIILKHTLKHLKGSYMFRSMIIIREHMQFLAEVCKVSFLVQGGRPPCTKNDVHKHDMLPHQFNEVFY
jgi:hypothetical protein